MTEPGIGKHVDLARGDLIRLDDARGTTLRVTRGVLWVTQERDQRDIVLEAGDAWMIERQGLTVAHAERPGSVAIVGPGALTITARERHMRWQDRLADWLQRIGEARFDRRWAPYL